MNNHLKFNTNEEYWRWFEATAIKRQEEDYFGEDLKEGEFRK